MAASAAAAQAHQRASTRRMGSATRSASWAWAAAYAVPACWAHWLAWTTRKRLSATSRRPSASSTGTPRTTLCPSPHPGGSLPVRAAADALPRPASRRLLPGPPRFCEPEGQRPVRLAPCLSLLAHRTRTRPQRDAPHTLLQAHPQRALTLGLPVGHHTADPVEAQGDTCLNRYGRLGTVTGMPIAQAHAPREPVPAPAETPAPPLPRRRRSTCLRSSRPSWLCPEAGRGGTSPWTGRASSSEAPYRVIV